MSLKNNTIQIQINKMKKHFFYYKHTHKQIDYILITYDVQWIIDIRRDTKDQMFRQKCINR